MNLSTFSIKPNVLGLAICYLLACRQVLSGSKGVAARSYALHWRPSIIPFGIFSIEPIRGAIYSGPLLTFLEGLGTMTLLYCLNEDC